MAAPSNVLSNGIYPISFPDHLAILLTLPDRIRIFNVPANQDELKEYSEMFRQRLQDTEMGDRYLFFAEKLYAHLIAPLESDLENIQTMIIIPDGFLRMIPFAALYDGRQFLAEKYAMATLPSVSVTDSETVLSGNRLTLLCGLSEDLKNVPAELSAVHETMGGKMLMNENFTLENLQKEFSGREYAVLHMATHAAVEPNVQNSYIQSYKSEITMDALADTIGYGMFRKNPLELLVLNACETAAGDERAALGLSGVALKAGARSVLATLWKVHDDAASLMIKEFCRELKTPGTSKAKALQEAQKTLIRNSRFQHPAYWSPYLLMGNWK